MNNLFGLEQNIPRNILAFFLLFSIVPMMYFLKPDVKVYERAMYLPLETSRVAIADADVNVVRNNNYFLYKKIGYITITLPDSFEGNATQIQTIEQAKKMAANAGANILFLEGMRSSYWFDSGLKIFRLQAVAMAQS